MRFKLIHLMILLSGCSSDSGLSWDKFLEQPNKESLIALSSVIDVQRCDLGNQENQKVVPIEKRKQFFDLISEGNEHAFHAGLLVSKCLDGGDLEDFHESCGLFFDKSPEQFFQIIEEQNFGIEQSKNMLSFIPLELTDDLDGQLSLLSKRIDALNSLQGKGYQVNEAIVNSLIDQKTKIEKIMIEQQSASGGSV